VEVVKPVLKFILFTIIGLIVFIILYSTVFYKAELFFINFKLSNIENTEVKNIWGQDVTLEEVTARIFVKNKGEIVLAHLC